MIDRGDHELGRTAIVVAWHRDDGARSAPCYLIDGTPVGIGEAGFDAVLAVILAHPEAAVTIMVPGLASGGQRLSATTPFADRFGELIEALGERPLNWTFAP